MPVPRRWSPLDRRPGRCSFPFLVLALLAASTGAVRAQADPLRNQLQLSAEPAAGGVRYLRTIASGIQVGAALIGGPVYGVRLSGPGTNEVREWGAAYPVVALWPAAHVGVFVSPIGVAAAIGNDFGTVYPGGQAGVEIDLGRVGLASVVRAVRIAGGNGSGDYQVIWVPLRAAYVIRW